MKQAVRLTRNRNPVPLLQRILLVTGDNITQKIYQNLLKELDFEVDVVNSGQTVLEYPNTADYAVMLLDLELPDLIGEVILTSVRLKALIQKQKHLPIVVTSTDERRLKTCLEYGADNALLKPVSCEILSQTLAELDLTPTVAAN